MPKDTLTITLNGEVSIDDFDAAIRSLKEIVHTLSADVGAPRMRWNVCGLEAGSATATLQGLPQTAAEADLLEIVVHEYGVMGATLASRGNVRGQLQRPTTRLRKLLSADVTSIRFETADFETELFASEDGADQVVQQATAFGAVRGRVQSMSNRGSLRFTLYELTDDKPVSCYVEPGFERKLIRAWGKIADVEGQVRRNPVTHQPVSVREVREITIIPESTESWREAIGCSPASPDDAPPEERIRKSRDAS